MRRTGLYARFAAWLIIPLSVSASAWAEDRKPGLIAFSARRWEGEYRSSDIPGGVQTTPVTGSIHTVRADGSDPRKIVEPGRDANAPAFSPDGRWLYFQSSASGAGAIYRGRPDGSEVRPIITPSDVGAPWKSVYGLSVAPDGRLVFTVHDGELGHVAIAEADGSRPRVIAPRAGYLYMGALGPTGETLACSGPAGGYRLQRIRLGGRDETPTLLTPDHPDSFCPQFTPDGETIVFFRRDGDIYRVGVDGSELRRLTVGGRLAEFRLSPRDRHGSSDPPDISPDGRRIAYVAERDGVANVHLMNLDGGEQRPVTARKTPCARVRWSPDGRQLAFVSFEGKYPQLFVVPADGGAPRQLTRIDGAVYFLRWQPKNEHQ
jgi:TolB protein